MKIFTRVETIDRNKALEYLSKNTASNRRITRANVEFLKNEIINGRFIFNGQCITFDEDGNLIDGQHRLVAVSETDKTIEVLVTRGVKSNAFKTIDTGKVRTAADVLSIEKAPNYNSLASAINRIKNKFSQERRTSKNGTIKFSNSEILEFYNENKDELDEYLDFTTKLYMSEIKIVPPAVAAAMMFLLKRENARFYKSFIRELFTGNMENEDKSAITLRKRLINAKIDGTRRDDVYYRNLFLLAFRGYCKNKNLSKIQNSSNQFFKSEER